jgi:hypothetical protein
MLAADDSGSLSITGEILGTPGYMSPEQFRGAAPDPRSDLYALGCIAYELATGAPPFSGSAAELAEAHMTRAPDPPSARSPDGPLPRDLEQFILHCLAKDPRARIQSAREVRAQLEALRVRARRRESGPVEGELDVAETVPARVETPPPSTARLEVGEEQIVAAAPLGGRTAVVRELGRALADRGVSEPRFLAALSRLSLAEDELRRLHDERAVLAAVQSAAEQAESAREGALRFQLGELTFERARLGDPSAEIDAEIAALGKRLAMVREDLRRLLEPLTERTIALTAAQSDADEEYERACAALEPLIDEARAGLGPDAALAALVRRLDDLRRVPAPR